MKTFQPLPDPRRGRPLLSRNEAELIEWGLAPQRPIMDKAVARWGGQEPSEWAETGPLPAVPADWRPPAARAPIRRESDPAMMLGLVMAIATALLLCGVGYAALWLLI